METDPPVKLHQDIATLNRATAEMLDFGDKQVFEYYQDEYTHCIVNRAEHAYHRKNFDFVTRSHLKSMNAAAESRCDWELGHIEESCRTFDYVDSCALIQSPFCGDDFQLFAAVTFKGQSGVLSQPKCDILQELEHMVSLLAPSEIDPMAAMRKHYRDKYCFLRSFQRSVPNIYRSAYKPKVVLQRNRFVEMHLPKYQPKVQLVDLIDVSPDQLQELLQED